MSAHDCGWKGGGMKWPAVWLAMVWLAVTAAAQPALVTVCNFAGTNGANPHGSLTAGGDGSFYGTTVNGGANSGGVVFKLATNGTVSLLASFSGASGSNSYAGLAWASNGVLYGTADTGGTGSDGTVFQVTTNGTLAAVFSFTGATGKSPQGGLGLGGDGLFYGVTSLGGNTALNGGSGYGSLFKVTTNGTLTTLTNFNNGNGAYPAASLTLGRDGLFYGVTPDGGNTNLTSFGYGSIFKVTTNGAFTVLFKFSNTNGEYPRGGLTLGNDGNFYGTTELGGSGGMGTVFRISTNGAFTSLTNFSGGNGAFPLGPLLPGSDGKLYGTTEEGGAASDGAVFAVTTNGVVTLLASFNGTNGQFPQAGLAVGADGDFYGTTETGGSAGVGTIFKLVVPPTLATGASSNHVFQASVTGLARPVVQIQYATNLFTSWSVLTNLVFTNGSSQFTNSILSSGSRFYRAMVQ